jgi:hypothetical protein
MIDPLHRWNCGPTVEFQYPVEEVKSRPLRSKPDPLSWKLAALLCRVDDIMMSSAHPHREWLQISLALSLPSSRLLELTEAGIGRQFGCTKMAVSKRISKFLSQAGLPRHSRGYNGRQLQ